MRSAFLAAVVVAVSFVASNRVEGAVIFSDDFEGTLAQWVGKGGGAHNGLIIPDTLNAGNDVLSFTALDAAGNIFATNAGFNVGVGTQLWLTFDYRTPGASTDGGGFAGYSDQLPGAHVWLAGTQDTYPGLAQYLIDDNTWHHYVIPFNSQYASIHVMLEEFNGSDPIVGNALFDNVQLWDSDPSALPAPAPLVLLAMGLLARRLVHRKSH